MLRPDATQAKITYRRDSMRPITRYVHDLKADDVWVSFVGEVEVADTSPDMSGRVKTVQRICWVPVEWVTEIEVLR